MRTAMESPPRRHSSRTKCGDLSPLQLLHHLLHLLARPKKLVDVLGRRPRAARNPAAACAVDDAGKPALLRRHREHDRLDARELPLVDVDTVELGADPRDELQDSLERARLLDHLLAGPVTLDRFVAAQKMIK